MLVHAGPGFTMVLLLLGLPLPNTGIGTADCLQPCSGRWNCHCCQSQGEAVTQRLARPHKSEGALCVQAGERRSTRALQGWNVPENGLCLPEVPRQDGRHERQAGLASASVLLR